MCIYVQSPLTDSITYLVYPTPPSTHNELSSGGATVGNGGTGAFFDAADEWVSGADFANGEYAVWGHPSDKIVGYDETVKTAFGSGESSPSSTEFKDGYIYLDQIFTVGGGFSKSPETPPQLKTGGALAHGSSHMSGYATCHWLRHCDGPNEQAGSPCTATLSGVAYKGFCFSSDTGSLECGHLTAIDNEYGTRPVAFDKAVPAGHGTTAALGGYVSAPPGVATLTVPATPGASGTVYRCPTGNPARGPGSFVSKRMLIAGCMSPADDAYDSLAEVHVPGYCDLPSDYKKGCLIPWATNYDPVAKQSGICHFEVAGCTSSNAVNYNSGASTDDGSCIEAVLGCTINSAPYAGVDTDTPAIKSGYHGDIANFARSKTQWVGAVAVVDYNPSANVLSSCTVAVEGCMDSTMVNYDSQATINTNTWCIPAKTGCMMPDTSHAQSGYHSPSGWIDALNPQFDIMTTVHDPSACVAARYGCMVATAMNFDPLANTPTPCYYPDTFGCLNPLASNFRCPSSDYSTPCETGTTAMPEGHLYVTAHFKLSCVYLGSSPNTPPSPAPSFPPGLSRDSPNVKITHDVVTSFGVDAPISELDTPESRRTLEAAFRQLISPPPDEMEIFFYAGSTIIEVVSTYNDAASADAGNAAVSAALGSSAASVQSAIGNAIGVTVLTAPTVVTKEVIEILPGETKLPVAGIAAGSAVGLILLVAVMVLIYRRKTTMKLRVVSA